MRATGKDKLISRAKGVLQGRLEGMRTMPFRVAPSAGDHIDLLDTYYRNRVAPTTTPACGTATAPTQPTAGWTGYVSATSAARCSYEPTGAFYRLVVPPGSADVPANFAVVVDTSFLSAGTSPTVLDVANPYDTQTVGRDRPPSSQVGVTATVLYLDHRRWVTVTTYTQISARTPADTRISLRARASTVELGAGLNDGTSVSLTAGQLDLSGSLANTSQATAGLGAVGAASSALGRRDGAALAVNAPYTNAIQLNVPADGLLSNCSGSCWGATAIPPFVLAADHGLPRAGVTGLGTLLGPVQTTMPDNVTRDGFQFRAETPSLPGLQQPLVSLDATPAPGELLTNLANGLYGCAFGLLNPVSHLSGAGYLNSTDELSPVTPDSVEACGGARSDVIRVLPTTEAPDGLVRITARSYARCTVTGIAHVPTTAFDYSAQVEYWRWTPALVLAGITLLPGHGQYVSAGTITPTTTTDPLASVSMLTPVSDTRTLGDYIDSWGALPANQVGQSAANHVAQVTIPALVNVISRPVSTDPGTAVSLAVGAASCRAEDNR
jgi:hypothetical protein